MQLGAFSISLNVHNIRDSQEFYEKLGFEKVGGDATQGWLILRNNTCTIGLFKGMIEKNTLTFNPGWDENAQPLETFQDVRGIQRHLKSQGIEIINETDEKNSGPGSFTITDPDGNPILIDQHI